jgi:hypothetical protein
MIFFCGVCVSLRLFTYFGQHTILTLWFSILLRVYYKSSLTSSVRNFSLIYLFILFLTSTTRHVSAHPQAILKCDSYKHNIQRRSLTYNIENSLDSTKKLNEFPYVLLSCCQEISPLTRLQ